MLTAKEIFEEYTKCVLDPTYPIESYFKTYDKTYDNGRGKFVPFRLFRKQREIIECYDKYRYNIVTKPRQAGVSTTTAAYVAVRVSLADADSPEAVLIIANKQEMAFEFLSKIKEFLHQMPRWVWGSEYYGDEKRESKPIFVSESKKEIRLPNGCRIKAVATSKDALRGYTPTYLIMDEAAFIYNGAEVFGAAQTALGTGGRCTLISTPNGQDELYYETYDKASKKKNGFNIIEMKWYQDDRYNKDLKWIKVVDKDNGKKEILIEREFTFESYEKKIRDGYKPTSSWYEEMCQSLNGNSRMIAQELDVSFLGSGGNVISEEYISHHNTVNVMEPKKTLGQSDEIWVWKEPIVGHEYILGSDVSRGDGEDYSTFVIIDITTMEQVAEFVGKIPADKLADLLYEYGMLYNAMVVVDITGGYGEATVLKLEEMKYPNLYCEESKTGRVKKKKDKNKYDHRNERPGFQVGSDRVRLVSQFERMVRINCEEGIDHGIKIRSTRLMSEINTFVYRNGRADHQPGKHDDIIMAMAMALYVMEFSFKTIRALKSKTKAVLAGWLSDGSGSDKKEKNNNNDKKQSLEYTKNMKHIDPMGQYSWLFSTIGG